jgi:hypothetical protein
MRRGGLWFNRRRMNTTTLEIGGLTPVSSSNIAAVGYSRWTSTLTVAFHSGGVYQYHGVPYSEYASLMEARSHGSYFHAHIRNCYRFRRVF